MNGCEAVGHSGQVGLSLELLRLGCHSFLLHAHVSKKLTKTKTSKQANKQTNKQTSKHTNKLTNQLTN